MDVFDPWIIRLLSSLNSFDIVIDLLWGKKSCADSTHIDNRLLVSASVRMAKAPNVPDPVQAAFEKAAREFKTALKNDKLYDEVVKTRSIDDVYTATDALQVELAKKGPLRRLSKIQPYLERLRAYSGVVETFVQVKPDVLALIWGPIKLLLQWTSTLTQSLDAIINTTAEIGELLPEFKDMTTMFSQNHHIKDVLALFFQDLLDFYVVALKFFSLGRKNPGNEFEEMGSHSKSRLAILL